MKNKNLFVRIFDSLLAKTLLPVLPFLWFTFFAVFGSHLDALIYGSSLTPLAISISIVMLVVIVFHACVSIYCQRANKKQRLLEDRVYTSILQNIDEANIFMRNERMHSLFQLGNSKSPLDYHSSINLLLLQLKKCISEITQIDKQKFVATYFYKFMPDETWRSINSDGKYKGLDIIALENPASVFAQLFPKSSTIFYCSKDEAKKNDKYICDKRDHEQVEFYKCPMGSIFGVNWSISDPVIDKTVFSRIITIATYGEEICSNKDTYAKRVLIDQILKIFEHEFLSLAFDNIRIVKESGKKA